jgi:hypothetical protein
MIEFEVIVNGKSHVISTDLYLKIVELCNICPHYEKDEGDILFQSMPPEEYIALIDNINGFVHDIQLNGDFSFYFYDEDNLKQVVLNYDKSLELKRILSE